MPLCHANGSTVFMEFSLSTVEIEGRPTVLSIGKDVTEQVRTSDALTAAEAKYRTLIERIPDAIWTCTADGTLTFITRNVSKILGYTAEEMMGETLEARVSWVHPDDRVRMRHSFREHLDHGIPFDIEYRHQRKDEKWIWVRSRGTATYELNGVRYVEGMLSDITERKQLEDSFRQAQKMEAVGQLTGGIAHDFNNLLSTILVNSHFLLTDLAVNDPRRADAEAIKAAADRAAGLTRQLLAFSRKQVLEPTILNLNSAVKDLEKMLCRLIGEDIEFLVIPAADLGSTRVDLSQLEQVVMNLVVNSRDAMPAGGKLLMETANVQLDELYVANHAGATPGNYVMLAVSDTGCGMDEATRRRIFEPFFTTKALGKGTGLGMSTCYGIVKQSGGYITVYSEPGHGTVVKVYLPRVDDRPALVTKKSISRSLEGRETILLIEDDSQVRAGASRILKGHGYAVLDASAGDLPMGLRQRLSLAVAVLHEPQILILDEPTSGVDPVARDSFWELLIDLSRKQGVTIFVTTHFMNEGMRCDRISLMNAGKVLACDAPDKLIQDRGAKSLEEAFIAYMEDSIAEAAATRQSTEKAPSDQPALEPSSETPREEPAAAPPQHVEQSSMALRIGRTLAYAHNETAQILRDPIRLAFAFVGSALLMLVFGFGITTDVEHIRYASLDYDQSPESRAYLDQFASAHRYFTGTQPATSAGDALKRLQSDDVSVVIEIPPNFGQDFRRGSNPEVLAQVDGAMTFRGDTVEQYVQGVNARALKDPSTGLFTEPAKYTADIEERYLYNPTFQSIYSIVPSVPALLLLLIPAILMTVSIVREKELGSIINFYVTPTARLEYLVGKQIPYVAIGMLNFFILTALALIVFNVPIKGSFLMLTLCTLLYVIATTGIGMVTSTFTSSQVAAVFVTAILTIIPTIQFSGLLQPVSTLEGNAARIGAIWPASYYMHSSLGAYTKGLTANLMLGDIVFLMCCIPVLMIISLIGLKKQER